MRPILVMALALLVIDRAAAQDATTFPCEDCEPASADVFWVEGNYIVRWVKPVCLKPVVLTLGSYADAVPGALGQPGTTHILVGNHKFEFDGRSGFSATVGAWLTPSHTWAIEASGFALAEGRAYQAFDSVGGAPATFLAYQNPANAQRAEPFSVPGAIDGHVLAEGQSQLWGVESNLSGVFTAEAGDSQFQATLLLGARYLDLRDRVTVTNRLSRVEDPTAFATGQAKFRTINQFTGGQIGCRVGVTHGAFSLDYTAKLAAGITHQVSAVGGNPLFPGSSDPTLTPGPFLALPSNIGREAADRVTLVPEFSLRGSYRVTDWCDVSLGYSLLYWNKVLCPGDQMDPHANLTQLPGRGPVVGPRDPARQFVHTDFFAHGFDAGLVLTY